MKQILKCWSSHGYPDYPSNTLPVHSISYVPTYTYLRYATLLHVYTLWGHDVSSENMIFNDMFIVCNTQELNYYRLFFPWPSRQYTSVPIHGQQTYAFAYKPYILYGNTYLHSILPLEYIYKMGIYIYLGVPSYTTYVACIRTT